MNNETYMELKKLKEKHENILKDSGKLQLRIGINKEPVSDEFKQYLIDTREHSFDVLIMIDCINKKVETLSYLCKKNLDLIKNELSVSEFNQVKYFITRMKEHPSMSIVKEFIHSLDNLFIRQNYNANKYGEFLNKIGFVVCQIEGKGEYVLQFPTITEKEELSMGYIHCMF